AVAAGLDAIDPVDEHQPRSYRQRRDCTGQRPQRGAADIIAVDASPRADGDADLGGRENALIKPLALDRGEFLGVVKTPRNAVGIENPRRRYHWTGQRTAPGLVTACHRKQPAFDGSPFARKGRPDGRLT